MKSKLYVFRFWAVGNGGMECFVTYKAFTEDISKEGDDVLESITYGVLEGDCSSGVRSLNCEKVKRPNRKILMGIYEDLKYEKSSLISRMKKTGILLKNINSKIKVEFK